MPKREDINKVLIIGSGPIIIGQACEFDYSGVWHISNQKRTSKPCNRLIFLSTFLLYYIVIFSDVWYTDNRGDNHAGDNI